MSFILFMIIIICIFFGVLKFVGVCIKEILLFIIGWEKWK